MERLTQWTEYGAILDLGEPKSDEEARSILKVQFKKACNKLAELEDELENGTLVELPCIRQTHNHKGQSIYRVYFINHDWGGAIDYYEFRDEAEAEKRLEELKG